MSLFYYPELRSVFIHNPKTGGRSIRLGPLAGYETNKGRSDWPSEWRDVEFCFTFVRHPFDRFMSAYRMVTAGVQNYGGGLEFTTNALSLPDFARRVFDCGGDPDLLKTLDGFIVHHTLPQSHEYYGLDRADFVGRFEEYARDWEVVADRLGVDRALPKMNRTDRTKNAAPPDWLKRDLERYYAEDFDRFFYEPY